MQEQSSKPWWKFPCTCAQIAPLWTYKGLYGLVPDRYAIPIYSNAFCRGPISTSTIMVNDQTRNTEKLWDRQAFKLLITSILRKFLCILIIKEFILGVTWRSRGKPGGKLHFLLSQQPVLKPIPSIKVSNYEWHNVHSNQSIMPQFAVEYVSWLTYVNSINH